MDSLISLALAGLAALRLWPMLTGRLPLSGDHMVHLYKSWYLFERLLPRGSFKGWSNMWYMGEPVGDLYPPGQDLWVAVWRALTLSQLSWEQTYGLAFVSYYALSTVVLFEFGRRHLGRAAGLIAALCWVLDPGGWEEGGWLYFVQFGVWGQSLGMALFLAGLSRTLSWMETGARRHLGSAGLLFGVGLLCHPTNLLLAAGGLPLLVLAAGRGRPEEPSRAVLAMLLGLAVGACFWLPFLDRAGYTLNIGFLGPDPTKVLSWTLGGGPFTEWEPPMGYLAVLGCGLALARRQGDAAFIAAMYLALLAAAGGVLTHTLHLHELMPSLSNINFGRLSIAAKSFGFLMIGLAVQTGLGWLRGWRAPAARDQARAGLGLVAAVWMGLVLVAWALRAPEALRNLTFPDEWPEWSDYQAYLRWSAEQQRTCTDFYRVAHLLAPHDHRLMAAPMVNHTPLLKIGYTPASMYAARADKDVTDTLERASVRFVLTDEVKTDPRLALVQTFGRLRVYELKDYSPSRVSLYGGGVLEVRRFDEEAIVLEVRGADPSGRVVLHMGNFPRWVATINGVETPTQNVPLWKGGPNYGLGLPARNGVVVLRYQARGVDLAGAWLSAAGLGLAAGLLRSRTRGLGADLTPPPELPGLSP